MLIMEDNKFIPIFVIAYDNIFLIGEVTYG